MGVIMLTMYGLSLLIAFFPVLPWVKEWGLFHSMNPYVKGLWWTVWFGVAHVFKYAGFTILGIESLKYLRNFFKHKKRDKDNKVVN